jgi:hypothetical protein
VRTIGPSACARSAAPRHSRPLGWPLALLALFTGGPAAAGQPLAIELNKLEPQEKGCRAYIVVVNSGETAYSALKLDLVMFRSDGVIGKRFVIDLAPMKPQKKSVKSFDLVDTACDQVGSLLVNEVMECATEAGPAENCLAALSLTSLSNVQLSK